MCFRRKNSPSGRVLQLLDDLRMVEGDGPVTMVGQFDRDLPMIQEVDERGQLQKHLTPEQLVVPVGPVSTEGGLPPGAAWRQNPDTENFS
jgi:hypothetical protein